MKILYFFLTLFILTFGLTEKEKYYKRRNRIESYKWIYKNKENTLEYFKHLFRYEKCSRPIEIEEDLWYVWIHYANPNAKSIMMHRDKWEKIKHKYNFWKT